MASVSGTTGRKMASHSVIPYSPEFSLSTLMVSFFTFNISMHVEFIVGFELSGELDVFPSGPNELNLLNSIFYTF